MPRVLPGIADAVKELVDTTHAKDRMLATLEDIDFPGNVAFAPVHVGRSCMRILRALLQKHVSEVVQDDGLSPRIRISLGCGGGSGDTVQGSKFFGTGISGRTEYQLGQPKTKESGRGHKNSPLHTGRPVG